MSDITLECVEWDGQRLPKGYGVTGGGKRGKHAYVHRLAWAEAHGPIPDGMCVLHRCDNPACFNVDHLFLGTPKDNSQDMVAKGRCTAGWHNRLKTHCPKGHPYDSANTFTTPGRPRSRRCLACHRERSLRPRGRR